MSLVEKVEQLNREISGSFDRAFSSLRRELQQRLRESHEDLDRRIADFQPPLPSLKHEDLAPETEQMRGEARAGALEQLRDAFAALDQARSQSAVLTALLAGAAGFASRVALLLWRGGELHGWGGEGFGDSQHAFAGLVLTPPSGSPWGQLADGGPAPGGAIQLSAADCAVLCGRIESPVPASGALVPLVLRDRTVAVLYADQLAPRQEEAPAGEGGTLSLPALQSLVYVAALAIESLPFRQREATVTLQAAGAAALGAVPATAASPAAPSTAGTTVAEPPAATAGEALHERHAEEETAEELAAPAELPAPAAASAAAPGAEPSSEASALPAAAGGEAAPAPLSPDAADVGDAAAAAASLSAPVSPASPESAAPAPRPAFPASAGAPFVSPVDLYDSPNVPLVKETAEIPLARPLRPVAAVPSLAGESPYLNDTAASGAGAASAATPAAPAGENETVLLPHASLRDAGAAAPGKKPADAAKGTGGPGLAVLPPLPDLPEVPGTTPVTAAGGEPPAAFATQAPTRGSASGGAATLRAVPPAPPLQPTAAASTAGAGSAADEASTVLSPTPSSPFEPLRTGPIGSSTPEVRPPTGVQGPGWAFATTRIQASSSEEALHEEARRLARLLVSEIKLYNEEQVELGRRNRDIYERLREDIDRSRQMYEERVEPRIVKATDYFYQELVRILAAGDSKALGI